MWAEDFIEGRYYFDLFIINLQAACVAIESSGVSGQGSVSLKCLKHTVKVYLFGKKTPKCRVRSSSNLAGSNDGEKEQYGRQQSECICRVTLITSPSS
jgi:hypothetical protein